MDPGEVAGCEHYSGRLLFGYFRITAVGRCLCLMWAGTEFIFIIYMLFAWAYTNLYGATSGVFFFFFLLKVLILIKPLLKCRVIAATNLLCCRLKLLN